MSRAVSFSAATFVAWLISSGAALGQSAAAGEIGLALMLVIGFGLHNATEGFGIVAPLAADLDGEGQPVRPSWAFLLAMGALLFGLWMLKDVFLPDVGWRLQAPGKIADIARASARSASKSASAKSSARACSPYSSSRR